MRVAKYRACTGQLIDANLDERHLEQFRRERVELLTALPGGGDSNFKLRLMLDVTKFRVSG